jgi:threonyl-tRNA synthetase
MERFVAILLEHTGGDLPLWLAPEQAVILPISEKFHPFAENVLNLLENSDIRASIDRRNEKIGRKIRDAETGKIPYMIIVGEKEANSGTVSVRRRKKGDLGSMDIEALIRLVKEEEKEGIKSFV